MSLIKRDFFSVPIIQTVTWNQSAGVFTTRQRVNGHFEQVPVEEAFALDYHLARHGYESWDGKDDARERKLVMASVSADLPEQPDKHWKPLYTVPVWSSELGGQRELVVKGEAATAAFADLFDVIEGNIKGIDELVVPVVSVSKATTDFGLAPLFEIADWAPRPDKWPVPIVHLA